MAPKDAQIQIRVSKELKAVLHGAAARDGQELSAWILNQLLPKQIATWQRLCAALSKVDTVQSVPALFAEIHDLLTSLNADELSHLMNFPPVVEITAEPLAYLASMLEHAAYTQKIPVPSWVSAVPSLRSPSFASTLKSLRLHLLINSPPAYRKRNIFVDSPLGGRI